MERIHCAALNGSPDRIAADFVISIGRPVVEQRLHPVAVGKKHVWPTLHFDCVDRPGSRGPIVDLERQQTPAFEARGIGRNVHHRNVGDLAAPIRTQRQGYRDDCRKRGNGDGDAGSQIGKLQ